VDEHEEDTPVAKKGHTEEQILRVLRQAEGGTRVADICREHGISEATFWEMRRRLLKFSSGPIVTYAAFPTRSTVGCGRILAS
jgi:putative transposase